MILVGAFGIAAVELGGRKGAKICWWIVVALFGLSIRGVIAAFGLRKVEPLSTEHEIPAEYNTSVDANDVNCLNRR